ncbi:LCP family protein [Paenibacillus sedimenti]|uniref:LCP family protein n=1 Tax=Paenibacillus sedimenti TaxID=2770274 RepID=A0A926KMB6_9BACL|nr:LCP family protein [Paenibacillus sedimenti]MBD0379758.1 LCP family protein [Paenibacillus sedimenti]
MKRWKIVVFSSTIASTLLLGSCVYWRLEPSRHFDQSELPVVSMPEEIQNESSEALTHDGIQNSSLSPAFTPSSTQSFNVLLLGIDARGNENSRSDVIMVIHVIPSDKKANVLSVPRDTRVNLRNVGYTKINHAHALGEAKGGSHQGTEATMQAVSDFLRIPINYYLKTDFKGFEHFIDAVGGVEVELKQQLHLRSTQKDLPAGKQRIGGATALSLVRERWAFPEGDFGRQNAQYQVLRSIVQEALAPKNMKKTISLIAGIKKDLIDTNFRDSDIISLAWMLEDMKASDFQYSQIPGRSGYDLDPIEHTQLYYWIPDMAEVKEIVEELFS